MPNHQDFQTAVDERIGRKRSYRVLIRKCDTADPAKVRPILDECIAELGIVPRGKTLIKPNCVTANRSYIHHSYTDPALVGQTIKLLKDQGIDQITVGESGGYGIPGRLFFSEAGYLELADLGAKIVDFNIEPTVRQTLKRAQHHKDMLVPQSIVDSDFLVWMPKLKFHICCTITCALKLNIGILIHKERMLYHDDRLDEKIVDMLEVGYPDLVITDAIEVGTGFESAPHPVHLGAIMVADDPVAMDIAACRVLGFEPEQCAHLMLAMERGFGPRSLDDVRIEGDVTVEQLRQITRGHVSEYQDIQKLDTPIRFYCGNDPERDRFCHGGCLAALKGCLGTIDKRRPGSVKNARQGAIVTGVYKGDVDAGNGVALLVGTCTKVEGEIRARKIVRVKGCPMGAKHLFFAVPHYFGMPSPLLDVRDAFLFIVFSVDKVIRGFGSRMARALLPGASTNHR